MKVANHIIKTNQGKIMKTKYILLASIGFSVCTPSIASALNIPVGNWDFFVDTNTYNAPLVIQVISNSAGRISNQPQILHRDKQEWLLMRIVQVWMIV